MHHASIRFIGFAVSVRCDRLQNGREAFGPSPIPAASITCRGSVPSCDVPASRGAWFVPKSMRLQPERSCSSVRRLDAVHRTDRAVSVTPGDGVGGTFQQCLGFLRWRKEPHGRPHPNRLTLPVREGLGNSFRMWPRPALTKSGGMRCAFPPYGDERTAL